MSQNGHPIIGLPAGLLGAVVVGSLQMSLGERYEWHSHPVHQLAWTERGVIAVSIGPKTWVLPPTRALWIPGGAVHAVEASRPSTMMGIYFRKRGCAIRWTEPTVVAVTPLIRELIRYLALHDLEPSARRHAHHVLFDLFEPLTAASIEITLPSDARARRVAKALLDDPADERTLAAFGRSAGASARTLARIFVDETGVTFGEWRMQVRLRASLVHLAEGEPVSVAASRVGYESASAFIAAFRRYVGVPPGAYFGGSTE